MTYKAPVQDQLFLLNSIVNIQELAAHPRYAAATPDLVEAIVSGAGEFAEQEYAPLADIGDKQGAIWRDGTVTLPEGFKQAYANFVANGWGTLAAPEAFGGQDLPQTLATVVMEDLGGANLGFSLINMLTPGAIESLLAFGTDAQKETWLPKLVTGEWNGTMNLTE
jgi:alkylation response protein AidB-like acyl-CoA dehydrogenase